MRSLVLGNGSLLVTFDKFGEVRDFYFPHVGLENHAGGELRFRIGIFVDNNMSWLSEDSAWNIKTECDENSLEGFVTAEHKDKKVKLSFRNIVYNESDIFLRNLVVTNLSENTREIKVYFGQEFQIGRVQGGDTAYFDPATNTIIHYKGKRVFLINGECDGKSFSDYAVGLYGVGGRDGVYRDAEDGKLSKNSIEHGSVDSVVGFYAQFEPNSEKTVNYWITASDSIDGAIELDAYVLRKSPGHLIRTSGNFWNAWSNKYSWNFYKMSKETIALFKKSLMFVRAHADDSGGIIASADADILQYKEDTYAYVWPRDAAYSALALARAGDLSVAKRFFEFCNSVITKDGYFMHKYLPDKSLGSSWHPWILNGETQLPIQEDETALVVWSLAEYYKHSKDLEFIENLYNSLIERAGNFMVAYRDELTGLPKQSYDIWEEKHGITTFTASSVYGALISTASFAKLLGKKDRERFYLNAAKEIREGILTHLVDVEAGGFAKMIQMHQRKTVYDHTADMSSVYGLFTFGVLEVDDPRLKNAFSETVQRLSVGTGIARYEHDSYYAVSDKSNPWIITTLWYAEYLIAAAKNEEDFEDVRKIFEWVEEHSQSTGVLSEQITSTTGEQCSVAPLAWSHGAYINAVLMYIDKLNTLEICKS